MNLNFVDNNLTADPDESAAWLLFLIFFLCVLWVLKNKKYPMGAEACTRFRKKEKKWRPTSGENPGFSFEIYGRKVSEHVCAWTQKTNLLFRNYLGTHVTQN